MPRHYLRLGLLASVLTAAVSYAAARLERGNLIYGQYSGGPVGFCRQGGCLRGRAPSDALGLVAQGAVADRDSVRRDRAAACGGEAGRRTAPDHFPARADQARGVLARPGPQRFLVPPRCGRQRRRTTLLSAHRGAHGETSLGRQVPERRRALVEHRPGARILHHGPRRRELRHRHRGAGDGGAPAPGRDRRRSRLGAARLVPRRSQAAVC